MYMRVKIRLDTFKDAQQFAEIAERCDGWIHIMDANGMCVNGKSILGALHAMEFTDIWCESENDIYTKIQDFVI